MMGQEQCHGTEERPGPVDGEAGELGASGPRRLYSLPGTGMLSPACTTMLHSPGWSPRHPNCVSNTALPSPKTKPKLSTLHHP